MTQPHGFNCKCETCESIRREARSHLTTNPEYATTPGHQEEFLMPVCREIIGDAMAHFPSSQIIPTPDDRIVMFPGGLKPIH